MSLKKSDEFKREAVQLALTSGLSRKQVGPVLKKWSVSPELNILTTGEYNEAYNHPDISRRGCSGCFK